MAFKKSKWTKVGAVLNNKDPQKPPYIIFGNSKAKDPKYQYTVNITVTDGNGNVVANKDNALLTIQDPRKSKFAAEQTIPDVLKFELFLVDSE